MLASPQCGSATRSRTWCFFAPDIDLDVASSKMFAWVSDPDLAFGNKPRPSTVPPQGPLHLTVYSSPRDKALGGINAALR
ncbi:alpha/beta hydrolase (plasmid) [Sinorhizobium meliloti]|nr:alpha/beta hydrolase [Sinorhizobium meliloti]